MRKRNKHVRVISIANADLRLSVQLDATDSTGCDAVQTTTGADSAVYGTHRAQPRR